MALNCLKYANDQTDEVRILMKLGKDRFISYAVVKLVKLALTKHIASREEVCYCFCTLVDLIQKSPFQSCFSPVQIKPMIPVGHFFVESRTSELVWISKTMHG